MPSAYGFVYHVGKCHHITAAGRLTIFDRDMNFKQAVHILHLQVICRYRSVILFGQARRLFTTESKGRGIWEGEKMMIV